MKSHGIGSRVLTAALIGVGILSSTASAQNGSWIQTVGPIQAWETAANWSGGIIANGQNNTATFATAGLTGPMEIQLNTNANGVDGRTIGNLIFDNPTNNFGWQIDQGPGFALTLATSGATAPNIAVNKASLTATFSISLEGTQGFTKSGPGTMVMQNDSPNLSGPIVINGGTLVADFSTNNTSGVNLLPVTDVTLANGGGLTLNGGTINTAPFQSLNSLNVHPGTGTFAATVPVLRNQATVGAGTLISANIATITRTAGGLLQFSMPQIAPTANNGIALTSGTLNTAGSILGGWAVVFLQPINTVTGSGTTAANVNTPSLMSWATVNPSTNALTALGTTGYTSDAWAAANNTNVTISGTNTIASGSTTNSLRFANSATQGFNVNLAGGTNTIASGGIMVAPSVGGLTATSIGGAGALASGGTNDLVVNQYNPLNTFTISANINNGSNGFTAGGTGTTILSGTNTYTGQTFVSGGTLLATTPAALPGFNTAGRVVVDSGTLAVSAGGTGWTSANIDSLAASASVTSGAALGIDVSAAVGSFTYASNVAGTVGLTKLDAGTLVLSGASTYTGPTTVSGGTLSVASLAASGASSPLGAGSSVVIGGGTLQYTGASTSWTRPISLTTGGGTFNTTNPLTLSGPISGTSGLTLSGGTLTLSGVNTYGGPTVVSAGQLNVNTASALPAGSEVAVNAGATVQFAVAPVLGALSGGGTVNIGNATTLTLGSDTASGVFQGVIANGTGGALALAKNGAGTQVLTAANTYTGGTTVNGGTLQISPQGTGVNPLGTGAVTLAGAGGANQATLAFRQLTPIPTSGYNQDVVWTGSEGSVPNQAVTRTVDGSSVFYTTDVAPNSLPNVPGGLPLNRTITPTNLSGLVAGTSLAAGSTYLLQPYTANNALQLAPQGSGTLSLLAPGKYQSINVLAASGNAASTFTATLNFSDSSIDTVTGLSAPVWMDASPFAVAGMGNYNLATGTFNGGTATPDPRLYQVTLPLSAADQAKTLSSITFQNTVAGTSTAGNLLNIFALNGLGVGAPTTLNLSNNVVISADSTLEVSGYTSVTLGSLRAGAGALTLNVLSGSTIAFAGGTTLTGNAAFNVPAGVTVGLGTVSDGNVGFGFTKGGPGTLTITNGTSYSPNGIVTINQGTLLINQPSGLPQDAIPGNVVVAGGATLGLSLGASPLWQSSDVQAVLNNVNFQAGSFLGLDVAPATTATLSLAISAPINLQKTNTGTLVLSNAGNTYSGSTSINGGVLSVNTLANGGQPSGIGASSNAASNLVFGGGTLQYTGPTVSTDRSFTINGGATIDVTQASTVLSVTGSGSGTGGLTKVGAGTLALSGLNAYTGGTTVNAGTVRVIPGALGAGTVTLSGGILSLGTGSGAPIPSNGFGTPGTTYTANGSASFLNGSTLQITPAANGQSGSSYTSVPIGTGPFTISFTYTVTAATNPPADGFTVGFQNYTGGVTGVSGSGSTTYSTQANNGGSGLGYQGITPSAVMEVNIYPPNTSGGVGSGIGFLVNGQAPNGAPATPTGSVNAGLVNDPTNIVLHYDGTTATVTMTQVVNGVTNTYTNSVPVNFSAIVGASAFFGFTGATGGANAAQQISNYFNSYGSQYGNDVLMTTPSATIQIAASAGAPTASMGHLTMAANSTLTVSADPSTPANTPFGLSFTGTTLNGADTFNIPANGTALGTLTLGALSNGAGASVTVTGGGNVNVAGGSVGGNVNLGSSSFSLGGASLSVGSIDGSGTLTGGSTKAAITLTFGSDNTSPHTYSGNISDGGAGPLGLVKVGNGTMTLSGTNTYSGGTNVQAGTLAVPGDGSLGTGSVTVNGIATLQFTGSSTSSRTFNLSSASGSGILLVNSGVTLTLNGGTIGGGSLDGGGTIATDATNGGRFPVDIAQAGVTIQSNSPADRFINFTNNGKFNVAAGVNTSGTSQTINLNGFTNQGDGSVTIGAGSRVNVANFQSYGTMTMNPATSPQLTLLTNVGQAALFFNGTSQTFIGTPATASQNVTALDLHGQNMIISDALFVNNGFVADTVGGSSIFVDYGALYKGAGTNFVPVITQNGGKFQAGNCPGRADFAQLVLGPGGTGNFGWEINDAGPSSSFAHATGVVGPSADANGNVSGWSLLAVQKLVNPLTGIVSSGNLTWSATSAPGHQLQFSLETLLGPQTAVGTNPDGLMADFNPNLSYVWPFATWQGGTYTGPTDSATLTADTVFDTSGFANSIVGSSGAPGQFSIAYDGAHSSLDLVFSPVPEPGTLALGSLAGLGLGWVARRRRKAKDAAAA